MCFPQFMCIKAISLFYKCYLRKVSISKDPGLPDESVWITSAVRLTVEPVTVLLCSPQQQTETKCLKQTTIYNLFTANNMQPFSKHTTGYLRRSHEIILFLVHAIKAYVGVQI